MDVAERIRTLRDKSGKTEHDLAGDLGLTEQGYRNLERHDFELESVVSIAQAIQLARLLDTNVLSLLGETEVPVSVPIARVRAGLTEYLRRSAEAKELLEDAIDWDLTPFLDGHAGWSGVYTIEFIKKLAVAVEVDWQVILGAIESEVN